jgi:DNA-binding PadR family transcriptional regulator
MVHEIDGLNPTDTDILRFLGGHKFEHFEAGPTLISDHIGANPSTVYRRLERLRAVDLVEESTTHKDAGRHRITDLGLQYLAEDLSDEEVEQLQERVYDYMYDDED